MEFQVVVATEIEEEKDRWTEREKRKDRKREDRRKIKDKK